MTIANNRHILSRQKTQAIYHELGAHLLYDANQQICKNYHHKEDVSQLTR